MKTSMRLLANSFLILGLLLPARAAEAPSFTLDSNFLKLPGGMKTVGDGHGDIALSPSGDIYVSVQGGERPGIQVYDGSGNYLRNLTGIAVAPGGDIYVTDGYGLDYIHRFSAAGKYLRTFGGKEAPWNFDQCHKIAIDTRFTPLRLLCTDRRHDRLVHMDLNGHVLGVFGWGLRLPSALAIHGDELAVGELMGRVSLLDRKGQITAVIGTNDNVDEIRTNKAPPEIWKSGLFYAPHGVTYDAKGNLLVSEFNQYGRITRIERK